jgi:hypothetical protein
MKMRVRRRSRSFIVKLLLAVCVLSTQWSDHTGLRARGPEESWAGGTDLIWQHPTSGLYAWPMRGLSREGDGAYLVPSQFPGTGWQIVGRGDFNNDGHLDNVIRNSVDGSIGVWLMENDVELIDGHLFLPSAADTEWEIVGVGDMDNNGWPDLVWQRSDGGLAIWHMQGLTMLSADWLTPTHFPAAGWRVRAVADMDGDGHNDLVIQNQLDGAVGAWLMNGAYRLDALLLTPAVLPDTHWKIVGATDVDDDGHADLVWHHQQSGALAVWAMNRLVQREAHYLSPSPVTDVNWQVRAVSKRPTAAAPTFSVDAGTYFEPFTVTVTSSTPGATVRYTTDGSEPIASSPVVRAPIPVDATMNLKAKAFKVAHLPSTATATYTMEVATPTFTPGAGTYSTPQAVAIFVTTPGSTIRYTVDGSNVTETSPIYGGPLSVDGAAVVQARAFRTGWTPSPIASATFTFVAAAPVFDPAPGAYPANPSISISTLTPGATIRYSTSGEPDANSPVYGGGLSFPPSDLTLRAKAFKIGWTSSTTTTGQYTLGQVHPAPVASPAGGVYDIGQQVSLSVSGSATIRYTINGPVPDESSPIYTSPIVFNEPGTLRIRAFASGYAPSSVATVVYAIRVARPTVTPSGGDFETAPTVFMASDTDGATIHYTTDRSEPTTAAQQYTGQFNVANYATVKARAFKPGWADSGVVTETYITTDLLQEEYGSPWAVQMTNVSPNATNVTGSDVTFALAGGAFDTSMPIDVYRNGQRLLAVSTTESVHIASALVEGRNSVQLFATDADGYAVHETITLWAGSRTVAATVETRNGVAIAGATVSASLIADQSVTTGGATSSAGSLLLGGIPSGETVRVIASAPGYTPVEVEVGPGASAISLALDIDNNAFISGLAGWTASTSRAQVIAHSEYSSPFVPCGDCAGRGTEAIAPENGPDGNEQSQGAQPGNATQDGQSSATTSDWDVAVDTKNLLGPQTVTRTFSVGAGSSSVALRYRFQTDELFTAYPRNGLFRDDWYSITLRSAATGTQVVDTRSISSLLGQFDVNAATPWMTLSLPALAGDTIDVTLTVSNAVDNAHMSILYADFVQSTVHRINPSRTDLRDLIYANDGNAAARPEKVLTALSASALPAGLPWGNVAVLHGTVRIEGDPDDQLQRVWIEVLEDGQVKAVGELARDCVPTLSDPTTCAKDNPRMALIGVPFGQDRAVFIGAKDTGYTPPLFEIASAELAKLNQSVETNNLLRIRVRARFVGGREIATTLDQQLSRLLLYTGTNRFGSTTRDLGGCEGLGGAKVAANKGPFPCGSDSWVLPRVKKWADAVTTITHGDQDIQVLWNDFSNMHGGHFPIHKGHRAGDTIDGDFGGFRNLDKTAGERVIAFLNKYSSNGEIEYIGIGYSTKSIKMENGKPVVVNGKPVLVEGCTVAVPVSSTNPFWNAVKDVTLVDGRLARNVIRNWPGHCDHFDIRVLSERIK